MKKIIDRIVVSSGAPGTYDLWIDSINNKMKVFVDGEWKEIHCDAVDTSESSQN